MAVQGVRVAGSVGMGIAVTAGISLLATFGERIYRKYQGSLKVQRSPETAVRFFTIFARRVFVNSFTCHALAGMVVIVIRLATSSFPFSVPAIAGLTVLSYLTTRVVKAVYTRLKILAPPTKSTTSATPRANIVQITRQTSINYNYVALYLSLKPDQNVYLQAHKMRKPTDGTAPADHDSEEWQAFVKAAQEEFSLSKLADQFASHCFNEVISQWSGTNDFDYADRSCMHKVDTCYQYKAHESPNDHVYMWSAKTSQSKLVVFSIADGSGLGKGAGLVAQKANDGFQRAVFDKMRNAQKLTSSWLVHTTVMAVDAAQRSALLAKVGKESANANTTHLGLIVLTDVKQEKAHCCFSSVGDCKLLARFPNGDVKDLTWTVERPGVTDPGGQLGMKYRSHGEREKQLLFGEIPDLRNFTVGYVQLPKGTILIPMTDGVYDNLNLDKIQEVITGKDGAEAVDAIIKAAKAAALLPGGKRDDTSCGWIDLA
jgi:serine/threonine protein phosphatase PrpC